MNLDHPLRVSSTLTLAIFVFLAITLSAKPVTSQEGPGATGAPYLVLPIGAKSIAMGEVRAALTDDPFNWLSNPAALAVGGGSGVGAFHSQWAIDSY